MNARVSLCLIAAALLYGAGAHAACPPGQKQACSKGVDLNAVPDITQQIVASETVAPAAKKAAPDTAAQPYTGPTVGVSDRVRRAPMVGYHWSLD